MKLKDNKFLIFYVMLVFVVLFNCKRNSSVSVTDSLQRTDTILRVDTHRVYFPPMVKTIFVNDTIYIHDTILVREQAQYRDSNFIAYVSGFQPRLDSIILFQPTTTIINNHSKKHRFHFGPSVGIGNNGAFIGVSLTYSLFHF